MVDEVHFALFSMYLDKSPRPDGLTRGFYQEYWDILKREVVSLCNAVVSNGVLLSGLNNTHIALIPKVRYPAWVTCAILHSVMCFIEF